MNGPIAAQVAFCSFVLFVAGLFISTFERMANQPTGFSPARVLTLESVSRVKLSPEIWYRVTQQVRSLPGVESALAQYALMSNNAQTRFVRANGHCPDETWSNSTWFLGVAGRDFRWDDRYPNVAVVNEKFARRYFGRQSPLGRTFESLGGPQGNARAAMRIVGVVLDARYEDMRLPVPATAYVPLRGLNDGIQRNYNRATFIVRTRLQDPMALASALRHEIQAAQPEIRVAGIVAQKELVQSQMVRERLLATLSLFFAGVALILAAAGLRGVLNYAVLERRRELGIRIALGANSGNIVRCVTPGTLAMIVFGSAIGVGLGLASGHYIAGLLYEIKPIDPAVLLRSE